MNHAASWSSYTTRTPNRATPRAEPLAWAQRPRDRAAATRVLQSVLAIGGHAGGEDDCFEAAVALYQFESWDQAFADLTVLADEGHTRASKLALLMLRYGPAVYGTRFAARPGQVARWAQQVLRAAVRPAM